MDRVGSGRTLGDVDLLREKERSQQVPTIAMDDNCRNGRQLSLFLKNLELAIASVLGRLAQRLFDRAETPKPAQDLQAMPAAQDRIHRQQPSSRLCVGVCSKGWPPWCTEV